MIFRSDKYRETNGLFGKYGSMGVCEYGNKLLKVPNSIQRILSLSGKTGDAGDFGQVTASRLSSISKPIKARPIPSVPPVTITTLLLKNDIFFFDTAKLG